MTKSSARRLAAVVAACLLTALPAAQAASAAPAHPAGRALSSGPAPAAGLLLSPGHAPQDGSPGGRTTYGVQPSGAKKPDARPNFSYGVTPGAAVQDHIAVINYGAKPLTLHVYAADAINTVDGGFDLLAGGLKSKDAGSWVQLGRSVVTIPGRARAILPFKLTVPQNATPGDHVGGIVASLSGTGTDDKGDKVKVDQRVGARIYLRVAGTLKPQLAVENLRTSYNGTMNPFGSGSATVTYTLRNTGNIRLSAHQMVGVKGMFGGGAKVAQPRDIPELLPGAALAITTTATGVVPSLRDKTTVTVDPGTVRGDVKQTVLPRASASAGFWAVPWMLLALLLILLGAAAVFAVRLVRRRRGPGSGADNRRPTSPGSRRPRKPRAAAPAAMALAAAVVWAAAPHAAAAPGGQLTVAPGHGTSTQPITLTPEAACPGNTTNVIARVSGAGFPKGGQIVVGNSPLATYPKTVGGGLAIPLTYTMRDYATTAGFSTLHGTYTFTISCLKGAFGLKSVGDFTGSVKFTAADAYRDGTSAPGAATGTKLLGADPGTAPTADPGGNPGADPGADPSAPATSGTSGSAGQSAAPGASGPATPGAAAGTTSGSTAGAGKSVLVSAGHSNSSLVAWSATGFGIAFVALCAGGAYWVRGRRARGQDPAPEPAA